MSRMKPEEFERLYEAHAAPLLAFLEYRTGDRDLAREIHADTFERVLTSRRPFDPRKASERTWLYTIALNRLRDLARRSAAEGRAMERLHAAVPSPSASAFDEIDARDALRRALATLSEQEREAIALRYAADLPLEEIARICGTPVSTIKGRLYHGLGKLRDELA